MTRNISNDSDLGAPESIDSASLSQSVCWGDLSFETARAKHVGSVRASHHVLMEPRNLVLAVNSRVGALCLCFRRSATECAKGLREFARPEKDRVALELGSAFVLLLLLADQCNVDLPLAIQRKIQLNAKKYPAVLVRGSALKYDAYQEHTGFAKGSKQVTTEGEDGDDHLLGDMGRAWSNHTLDGLRIQLQQFAKDRGWEKFHTPRNICLALSGEAGELCELFQFMDEEVCCMGLTGWTRDARDKLSQELSDVCIYLCRLSDLCAVDLCKALEDERLVHPFSLTNAPAQDSTRERHKADCPERPGSTSRWGYLAACLLLGLVAMTCRVQRTKTLGVRRLP